MLQSLASILVHLVLSTKDRSPWIADDWRDELHGYIGGIIRRHGGDLLAAGSVEDHIHLLFPLPRTAGISELAKEITSGSTRWVHDSPARPSATHWQAGYAAFSFSPSHKESVRQYIASHREHHTTTTFQNEYRKLLSKYGIEHDEDMSGTECESSAKPCDTVSSIEAGNHRANGADGDSEGCR